MSRKYANLLTAIWDDEDFRALPASAQRTYMMLLSQRNITAAGTLPLTVGRWGRYAVDTKPSDLRTDFEVLEAARFIVVDEDTEELLVRTFIVWDGGVNNEKRQPVIRSAAEDISSPKIRAAFAGVLARLKAPRKCQPDWYADSLSTRASDALRDAHAMAYPMGDSGGSEPTPSFIHPNGICDGGHSGDTSQYTQADSLSDAQPDAISRLDRVVVTEVSRDTATHNPLTTTHNPLTSNRGSAAKAAAPKASKRTPDDDPEFAKFWAIYPRRESKGGARDAWSKALAAAGSLDVILAAAERYRDWPGREARFTKLPSTWLNQECWNDELASRRAASKPQTHQPYRDPDMDAYRQEF